MRRVVLPTAVAFAVTVAQAVSPATEWAHEEFTNYTARVFGVAPKVCFVLPDAAACGTSPCRPENFKDDFAALKGTDGYAVRRRGDTIFFIADCAKGHVNGVHRWLEKNSDIIWPRPAGDLCFFTPVGGGAGRAALPTDNHQLPTTNCDYRDIPAFKLRYFGGASDDETRRYLARNAVSPVASVDRAGSASHGNLLRYGTLGAYCDVYGAGHDMETRWFPRNEYFKDHPEYWMEIDGERWTGKDSNFCETNPDFVKAYCGSVLAKIAGLPPSVKIVSINMEDTSLTCTCRNCLKPIALPDGSTIGRDDPAFKSTRFFIFFNEVARAVAKARPDLKILQFAYLHLSVPPKVPVERNVILKFCPYPRNMRESVMFGPSNEDWRKKVEGWLANTPELYWREYYFCQCILYPRPMADTAALDLREIARHGVKYVYTDSPGGHGDGGRIIKMYSCLRPGREFYDMCAMEAWTMQKLFWDPSLDPEALRAEFLRRTFGPSAPHVAEFYRLLRDSWNAEKARANFNDDPSRSAAKFIVAKGLAGKCRAALVAAEAAADMPARRTWIVAMRHILERWVSEASNFVKCDIPVPMLADGKEPAMDIAAQPWTRARELAIKAMRGRSALDRTGSSYRIYSDGDSFHVACDVKGKNGAVHAGKQTKTGGFPSGDRVELFFGEGKKPYSHFAFGPDGSRFEAKGLDASWTCDWKIRTEKTADGWRAVVRIPFDAIGFEPHGNPRIRFLLAVPQFFGKDGEYTIFHTLGGGVPHAPSTWLSLTHNQF